MFYYYGRKKQLARYYPEPNYQTIIEPFAGSAAYSLFGDNWKKDVILIEKDKRIFDIWDWLINEATVAEISKLPTLEVGEKSSEFLHIIHAATKMAFKYKTIKTTPVLARNWEISLRVMQENLHKVKHWKIYNKDYQEFENIEATWFIDPPYKGEPGLGYGHSSKHINYDELSKWALSRKGEIICCEGVNGDYLPFVSLKELSGVAGKSSPEKIYYRSEKNQKEFFQDNQLNLLEGI